MARVEKAAGGAATAGRAPSGSTKKGAAKPPAKAAPKVASAKAAPKVASAKAAAKKAPAAKPAPAKAATKTPPKAAPKPVPKSTPKPAPKPAANAIAASATPSAPAVAAKPVAKPPAKAAPTKAPTPAVARKEAPRRGAPLDKFFTEQRQLLLEERATHLRQAESLKEEADALAAEMEPGESEFGEEGGEGGNLSIERELDLVLSAQAKGAVDEIDRALGKIDAGTYGYCEKCGKEIPRARLKVLPHALLCVACKSGGLSRR